MFNLPNKLIDSVQIILEMSYHRKRAMELIPSHSMQLARKMVMLHHMPKDCPNGPHWETSANAHINEISALTDLKGNKKLSNRDIHQVVVDEPFGEYRNYLKHHNFISTEKSDIAFSPPTREDYALIKDKYDKLENLLSKDSNASPRYSDL